MKCIRRFPEGFRSFFDYFLSLPYSHEDCRSQLDNFEYRVSPKCSVSVYSRTCRQGEAMPPKTRASDHHHQDHYNMGKEVLSENMLQRACRAAIGVYFPLLLTMYYRMIYSEKYGTFQIGNNL